MKINRLQFVMFMSGLLLIGCSPKEVAPNENIPALNAQFHGKYKIIRSVSSEAVDVNLDGISTTDMMVEIPELSRTYSNNLEIRIYGSSMYRPDPSFSIIQWWPEQYIRLNNNNWEGEPIDYQPGLIVNYAMQGGTRRFVFSSDLKSITVQPNDHESAFRWVFPESVTVNPDNTIEVVNKRKLYTSEGVKEFMITTVYERYTTST